MIVLTFSAMVIVLIVLSMTYVWIKRLISVYLMMEVNILRNVNARIPDYDTIRSCPGSEYHILYEPRFDGQKLSLVEVGREEIQPKIAAYAPYTDLVYMLSRLKVNDLSVLNQSPPLYGDFSGMPDNPVDAINLIHGAERAFGELPAEEKQTYNNDYRVWLSQLFSVNSAPSVVADLKHSVSDESVKEVHSDES